MKGIMVYPLRIKGVIIVLALLFGGAISCNSGNKKTESESNEIKISTNDSLEAKKLTNLDLWLNGEVEDYLTISYGGICRNCIPPEAKIVTVYVIFKKDMNEMLLMKAFDKNDTELGRSEVKALGTMDDANYIDFTFDPRTPMDNVAYCSIQFKR